GPLPGRVADRCSLAASDSPSVIRSAVRPGRPRPGGPARALRRRGRTACPRRYGTARWGNGHPGGPRVAVADQAGAVRRRRVVTTPGVPWGSEALGGPPGAVVERAVVEQRVTAHVPEGRAVHGLAAGDEPVLAVGVDAEVDPDVVDGGP